MSQYRSFLQGKTRILVAWIFSILLGLSSQHYPHWLGIVICFLGATLRYWASGYLRKDNKPAVGGPYAWIRNPLYFGTYLMALGILAATQQWILLAVMTVVFAAVYHFIILEEEIKLRKIFGAPYELYCQHVPRFFPKWSGPISKHILEQVNREGVSEPYSREIACKNKAYEAYASFIGLVGFSVACAFFWQLH